MAGAQGHSDYTSRTGPRWPSWRGLKVYSRGTKRGPDRLGDHSADGTKGSGETRRGVPTRQAHRKHRALTLLARHGHVSAHHVGLGELLEHFRLLLGRHAYAAVGYSELDPVASVDQESGSKGMTPSFCESH
jgi:hypothetical protein